MTNNKADNVKMGEAEKRKQFIISLIDLTSLNSDDTPAQIKTLCKKAQTPYGTPAALCIYKQFLPLADEILRQKDLRSFVKLATVANFPEGQRDSGKASAEVAKALSLGADEVDIVFPYHALQQGNPRAGHELVRACRQACDSQSKILKVILETGVLKEPSLIMQAAQIAVEEGADFLKTSTGKVAVNATLPAARIMLGVIVALNKDCGFKAAGGVRTEAQAEQYLTLAAEILGQDWLSPWHFRFGTSALLDNLLVDENKQTETQRHKKGQNAVY